jgi:hypothetical protein
MSMSMDGSDDARPAKEHNVQGEFQIRLSLAEPPDALVV